MQTAGQWWQLGAAALQPPIAFPWISGPCHLHPQTACLIEADLLQPHTRGPCRGLLCRGFVGLGRGKRWVAGVESFLTATNAVITLVGPAARQEQRGQNRQEPDRLQPHTTSFVIY